MITYSVYGQDNDTYAFRQYPAITAHQRVYQAVAPDMSGITAPGNRRCTSCGELLNKWEEQLKLVVARKGFDIGSTYDGLTIVSRRFKVLCESATLTGLLFTELPNDSNLFSIRPLRSVEFDAERRKTRFINRCPSCNRYESVVGASPVYLKPGTAIGQREFVRTDLEFGSKDEKHPLILCGDIAAETLASSKLRGLDLVAVDNDIPKR